MKKIILLASLVLATQTFAMNAETAAPHLTKNLFNYSQVLTTVLNGEDIRIGLVLKECTVDGKKIDKPMPKIGFYTPNEVMVTHRDAIAMSLNHFTTNDPRAMGKPVYQFLAYALTPDDKMTVSAQLFDAQTHSPLSSKEVFLCELGRGVFISAK